MTLASPTRLEAEHRSRVLTAHTYAITLDLTGADSSGTFRSVIRVRFDCADASQRVFLTAVRPAIRP